MWYCVVCYVITDVWGELASLIFKISYCSFRLHSSLLAYVLTGISRAKIHLSVSRELEFYSNET
jgi:hypothetical protein